MDGHKNLFVLISGGNALSNLLRYHMMKRYFMEKTDILTTMYKQFYNSSVHQDKNSSDIYSKRIQEKTINQKYFFLFVKSIFTSLVYVWIFFIYTNMIILFKNKRKKNTDYFHDILFINYCGIPIGDCICSSYLRSKDSNGYLELNLRFIKIYFTTIFKIKLFDTVIKNIKNDYSGKKYFHIGEVSYVQEAYRRLLLKYGFEAINFNEQEKKYALFEDKYFGYQLRRLDYYIKKKIDEIKIQDAEHFVDDLVYRRKTLDYMSGSDVDIKSTLHNLGSVLDKKIAVIFLHAVSDIQYEYGVGCFNDLHDWLIQSIDVLRERNINVVIKAHPSFFNKFISHFYQSDRNYLLFLNKYFDVDIVDLPIETVISTKMEGVFFVNHKISFLELSKAFKDFLCISHHGTVAIEAAFLDHVAICSSASPYPDNNQFVFVYKSKKEYENLLDEWSSEKISKKSINKHELFSYVYEKKIDCVKPDIVLNSLLDRLGIEQEKKDISENIQLLKTVAAIKDNDDIYKTVDKHISSFIKV